MTETAQETVVPPAPVPESPPPAPEPTSVGTCGPVDAGNGTCK